MSAPTSKVTSQHEIQYEKAIIVILESVAKIDYERVVDLRVLWSDKCLGPGQWHAPPQAAYALG